MVGTRSILIYTWMRWINIKLLDILILREINFAHLKDHSMNYDEAEDGDLEVRDGDDDCELEASPT